MEPGGQNPCILQCIILYEIHCHLFVQCSQVFAAVHTRIIGYSFTDAPILMLQSVNISISTSDIILH